MHCGRRPGWEVNGMLPADLYGCCWQHNMQVSFCMCRSALQQLLPATACFAATARCLSLISQELTLSASKSAMRTGSIERRLTSIRQSKLCAFIAMQLPS